MERASINGVELAYEVSGTGDPVLTIHGALGGDAFLPLAKESALKGFQVIRYHRRGHGQSGSPPQLSATTTAHQAADAIGLLDHLEIEQAHVVGHSSGGTMALEAAARNPRRVLSLALLEPVLPTPSLAAFGERLGGIMSRYHEGDARGAVLGFLGAVTDRDDWLDRLEQVIPGCLQQAVDEATTFFAGEVPASAAWSFGADDAALITCPVLSVVGEYSTGIFREGRALLQEWFPNCHDADIAGADHFLQMTEPGAVAAALVRFLTGTAITAAPAAAGAHR